MAQLIGYVAGGVAAPAVTAAIVERTEGLPFFVEELVEALLASKRLVSVDGQLGLVGSESVPLPDSVGDAVTLRSSGLNEATRAALDVAAVAGVDVDVTVATEVTRQPWPDELDHSGLLVAGPSQRRRFRHVLVQQALYQELPWSRRRTLHLAIAECLSNAPDCEVAVARHLLAGRDLGRARPALVAAAAIQMHEGAYRDAAGLLTAAIESWPASPVDSARREALDRLAQCWELCGEHGEAIVTLRELILDAAGPEVHRRLAAQYEQLGQWPLALAARETAAAAFRAAGEIGACAEEHLSIADHLRSAASFRAALDTLETSEDEANAAGRTDLLCRVQALRGNVLARMGRVEEGVALVASALDSALADGLVMPAAGIYQRLADAIEHAGDQSGALSTYEDAYSFCRTHELGATSLLCRACATVILFDEGRWDQALNGARDVVRDGNSSPHARAVASGVAGLVWALRGQTGRARPALLESRATASRIQLVAMTLLSGWGLALLDEASGRLEDASRSYRHVVECCAETEERHYCIPVLEFATARTDSISACARSRCTSATRQLTWVAVRAPKPSVGWPRWPTLRVPGVGLPTLTDVPGDW